MYSSVINNRLTSWTSENKIINEEQNGFIKHRSCQDHLQSFTSIIETRKLNGRDTYACFIDFSKAYDRIPRSHLWFKLNKLGVTGNILKALQALYSGVKCNVRVMNDSSDSFNVTCGLKQGCLASPLLFNLYINDLITQVKMLNRGVNINGKVVSLLLYADDIVLLGSCAKDIQDMLNVLNVWCKDWSLAVNPNKSKVMHFRRTRS